MNLNLMLLSNALGAPAVQHARMARVHLQYWRNGSRGLFCGITASKESASRALGGTARDPYKLCCAILSYEAKWPAASTATNGTAQTLSARSTECKHKRPSRGITAGDLSTCKSTKVWSSGSNGRVRIWGTSSDEERITAQAHVLLADPRQLAAFVDEIRGPERCVWDDTVDCE